VAKECVQEVLRRQPDFSVETFRTSLHYRNDADLEHHRQALLKAGLPA